MVCSLGSTRMTVMARLLAAGSFSQNIAEEVGCQKTAAQHIHRELCEADESNLLDEEDMCVFGLNPMTDPLHLVRCNACKKPVKASHYAAHAELCRSLCVTEETILELDGGIGCRKPSKKERKKPVTKKANQATQVEQERRESIGGDDTVAVQLSGQIGMASSVLVDVKNAASLVDVLGGGPEKREHSTCPKQRLKKRSKMKVGRRRSPLSDDPETAPVVKKCTGNEHASRKIPIETISGSEMPNNSTVNGCSGQAYQCSQRTKGVPMPLATKIYYSQRNNRLRSALSQMYSESSTRVVCNDLLSSQASQQVVSPLTSSQRNFSLGEMHNPITEKLEAPNCNQTLAQKSDVPLAMSGGYLPTPTSDFFSNQFPVDNGLIPQTAPVESTRTKYLTKPYAFVGNSGNL